tara:strand:+ start:1516 stop:3063 length:1548 start_codon:yes stop_codon:yes gene_type:complete
MENSEYLKNQISIMINLFKAKRFDTLIDKGLTLLNKFPEQPILYNIISLAYNALEKGEESKKLLIQILKKEPENFHILNNLGLASVHCGDTDEAENYYNRALKLKPDLIEALVNLGNLKTTQNKNDEAKEYFIKAIEINDKLLPPKLSLAGYYEQSGDFEKAKKIYNEILEINPNFTIADKSLSLIQKYKPGDTHLKSMEKKLKNNIDDEAMRRLNFALGKAYEDIGEYEKSFKFYEAGNKLYKKEIKYDSKNDTEYFDRIKKAFEEHINNIEPLGQKIIFVVGMPRSGTTLTEQILSSHKDVYGAGELSFLKDGIEKKLSIKDNILNLNSNNLNAKSLREIRDYYLEKIKIFKNTKDYLVDKAPLNFKWIGLIMKIFPDSKIIHCTRSPMDICWSNYKNTFSSRSMNYTYDFADLVNFYKLYDDLMNFWQKKFDKKIFNMNYENLIANKEVETKRLIKFCELDWDDKCLDFHKNKRSVSTASLAQVREPLYKTSIEKWKNYSKNLEILINKLGY